FRLDHDAGLAVSDHAPQPDQRRVADDLGHIVVDLAAKWLRRHEQSSRLFDEFFLLQSLGKTAKTTTLNPLAAAEIHFNVQAEAHISPGKSINVIPQQIGAAGPVEDTAGAPHAEGARPGKMNLVAAVKRVMPFRLRLPVGSHGTGQ